MISTNPIGLNSSPSAEGNNPEEDNHIKTIEHKSSSAMKLVWWRKYKIICYFKNSAVYIENLLIVKHLGPG